MRRSRRSGSVIKPSPWVRPGSVATMRIAPRTTSAQAIGSFAGIGGTLVAAGVSRRGGESAVIERALTQLEGETTTRKNDLLWPAIGYSLNSSPPVPGNGDS